MDPVLKQLQELRNTAGAELEAAAQKVRALDKMIADYQASLAKVKSATQGDLFSALPRGRAERAEYVARMMDAAEQLILAARRPMTRTELLEALTAKGFHVEGGDASKVLGTNLWRSKRFESLKGIGYWPKSAPLPAAFADAERRPSMLG